MSYQDTFNNRMSKLTKTLNDEILVSYNLKPVHYQLLHYVKEGLSTLDELSNALGIDITATHRRLAKLKEYDLVHRVHSKNKLTILGDRYYTLINERIK